MLAVAVGGAVGAVARLGVTQWLGLALGRQFPWGTLAVNVLGSFVIGLLYGWWSHMEHAPSVAVRAGVVVGFLGAFTTMSSFSLDFWELLHRHAYWKASAYLSLTLLGAFVATGLGIFLTLKGAPKL
jgi:CrcB protein